MPLVIYGLGGGHTHMHTSAQKRFQETRRAPGLIIIINYMQKYTGFPV